MGVDSTAILLRWLDEPASRDFELSDLIVITAMTGDEFPETGGLVKGDILPLLRAEGVRYVQVARRGPSQNDGIEVLSDTRQPTELFLAGAGWRLSDELAAAGTLPTVKEGKRLCTQHFKGWPLDTWLEEWFGAQPFRHVIGYNADELRRSVKDHSYIGDKVRLARKPEHPLIEWGWGRAKCEEYIWNLTGVRWPKSCCTFCPFASERHLDRYRANPDAAVQAMLMEHTSLALNPRVPLFGKHSVIQLVTDDGNIEAVERFHKRLSEADYALYEVRRFFLAAGGDPTKKGRCNRAVRTLMSGSHIGCSKAMRAIATETGRESFVDSNGVQRLSLATLTDRYPTFEWDLVVAPAGVEDKKVPSFETIWRRVTAGQTCQGFSKEAA